MIAPIPNVPMLREVLAHIEANPRQWYQGFWWTDRSCGTAYCFAGWTAVLSGAKRYGEEAVVPPEGGDPVQVDDYAAGLLGIEPLRLMADDDGPHLFDELNTLDDLRQIVADLCGEAGEDDG